MFRSLYFSLFSMLLLFSLVACKKGKAEFTLEGALLDLTYQTVMTGEKVELYQIEAGTNAETLIATTQTDSEGKFVFTFKRDKAEKYILRAAPANYFPVAEDISFSDLSIEVKNLKNLSTTAKAWVKLVFTNVDPVNSWDDLRFEMDAGKTDCEGCLSSDSYHLLGDVDTVIYTFNDGNTLFRYYYEVMSTPVNGYKSATTPAFDTTTILLEY
jgi:hypothetical protein